MNQKSKRFPDRMKKLHRLLAILRMFDNRKQCTSETLAAKFNTTKRNIFRDINDLNSAGFAITFDKEQNTYAFIDPDFTLRDLDLSDNELMALLLGKQISHSIGRPFENAFTSLLKKARKDTGDKTKGRIKRLTEKQKFWVDIDPMDGFENIEEQYNTITEAMDKNQEVEITYQGMHERKETRRQIAPYGLFFHSGMWYVIAYCNLRYEIREFALDCIKDIRITSRHYTIPQDFNMDDYFKSGWHIMRYGEPVEVVLRFSKNIARWIKRRKWHPTQTIKEQKDGSIIFKVKLEGTKEIKWWTYHWAPNCEIISPPELRKEAAEEIRKLGRCMGKNEVIVPFMEFGKICNGQYTVGVNLNGTGINITEVILDKINEGAQRRIVTCKNNILEYTSETLLPPPKNIDNKKTKVLFVLGNPALHSIENGMFYFSDKNDDRHGFWGKLDKAGLLENFDATCEEDIKKSARKREAEERRNLILSGNTNDKFVIGLTTFYSLPTPTGIPATENPYCDSKGVKKLFGSKLFEKSEKEEFARIITGVKNQPEVSAFANNAILIPTIIRARDYLCGKINDGRVKYWPMFDKSKKSNKSGGEHLKKMLKNCEKV